MAKNAQVAAQLLLRERHSVTMNRIDHFSITPFARVAAAMAHPLGSRVVRGGSTVCRIEADPDRFHPRASSISAMCAARSRG
jgi:hypothetical protein